MRGLEPDPPPPWSRYGWQYSAHGQRTSEARTRQKVSGTRCRGFRRGRLSGSLGSGDSSSTSKRMRMRTTQRADGGLSAIPTGDRRSADAAGARSPRVRPAR